MATTDQIATMLMIVEPILTMIALTIFVLFAFVYFIEIFLGDD